MKKFYLVLFLCLFVTHSYSQTQLFGGSVGNGNFENGSTDWVLVNGTQASKWVVSNNATPGFSGNCIYITSSSTAPYTHTYNTITSTYSYFYKDVAIPAGTKTLWLVFDYICNGQLAVGQFGPEAKDALRIWARSTGETIVAGQQLSPVIISPSVGYYNQSTWKKEARYLDVTGFAGSTMRIVFQWFNDASFGIQPPAALDNIECYASCQEPFTPGIAGEVTATVAYLSWSPIRSGTGYDVRWRKMDEPTTVSTWANPRFLTGGDTFTWMIEDLTPATNYIAEVRPTGTPCTDYAAPIFFKTLTPPTNDVCSGAYELSVEPGACTGIPGSFYGATPSTALANPCANGDKTDVWFKFSAQQARQIIQTTSEEPGIPYTAKNIRLYSGTCASLQAVTQPCAVESYSLTVLGNVSRLIVDNLTPGNVYYIRVTSIPPDVVDFRICVYNEPAPAQCSQLLTPADGSTINYGIPQLFTWTKSQNASAYKLKIIQQSGAYTEVNIIDTFYMHTPLAGINYTWNVAPYNALDQSTTCSSFSFTTCASAANPNTISATGTTSKCALDSVKLTASTGTNIQWFLNNQLIPGATSDIFWAKLPGNYTVRVLNGPCYSDPSNAIAISNLPTPVKPSLQVPGSTTFCEGGSVTLTSSLGNINNQWFKNTAAIAGANGDNYVANSTGAFYLRITNTSSGCHNYSDTANVVTMPRPATPTISAGGPTDFCQGGSVVLTSSASGGNQWKLNGADITGATNSNFTASAAGNYTVVVTSNGCTSAVSAITNVTVTAIPATPVITPGANVSFCSGGSVLLTSNASSGNQWYNGTNLIGGATSSTYTANAAGTYSVKVIQNGCASASSNTVTVSVLPLPATPTINWNGTQLSTVSGFTNYQWLLNNNVIAGATSATYTPVSSGLYKVTIRDAFACQATSAEFNLVATGINDITLNGVRYSISPNPARSDLFIKAGVNNPHKVELRMMTATGAVVLTRYNVIATTKIPVNHLPAGVYFILLSSKREKGVFRIVINH